MKRSVHAAAGALVLTATLSVLVAPSASASSSVGTLAAEKHSRGLGVECVQYALQQAFGGAGNMDPRLVIDGDFGPVTRNWTRVFQDLNALSVDGQVGRITGTHLMYFIDHAPTSRYNHSSCYPVVPTQ